MPKKTTSLGKSLVRDYSKKNKFVTKDGYRHTSDLPDGFDWGRLNLNSVTEQSSLNDFLDKVQLADNEYTAEFSNIEILSTGGVDGLLTEDEKTLTADAQERLKDSLCIPRRPPWDITTTKSKLESQEQKVFLEWRRKLALLKEEKHVNLTPYEKNLEVWKQLWRVIEKSDVVVQIIDARNPLQFRCGDLEVYVKEIDSRKKNMLLLNKADFISETQRQFWAQYFASIGVKIVFFSALQEMQNVTEDAKSESCNHENTDSDSDSDNEKIMINSDENKSSVQDNVEGGNIDSDHQNEKIMMNSDENKSSVQDNVEGDNVDSDHQNEKIMMDSDENKSSVPDNVEGGVACEIDNKNTVQNSERILSKEELVIFLKQMGKIDTSTPGFTTIGMVGYPNVGKSSTINAVLLNKKVQVSATPGKTKHFQTHMIDSDLCFCDCPGLVFPNFVSTKADMVINGILPIDQLTEHTAPVTLVTNLIPRPVLESTYSIMIPSPAEGKDPSNPPTAEELLNAYGYMRGFMTQRGLPDNARSARYILKDFVNGKLLFCHAPPNIDQNEYLQHSIREVKKSEAKVITQSQANKKFPRRKSGQIDKSFFKQANNKMHIKGVESMLGYSNNTLLNNSEQSSENPKPWKKHNNRNKKEKSRRVYAD